MTAATPTAATQTARLGCLKLVNWCGVVVLQPLKDLRNPSC